MIIHNLGGGPLGVELSSHNRVVKLDRSDLLSTCAPTNLFQFDPPMSRREKIEAMLADSPDDSFLRYSLAMELRSEGAVEKSLDLFGELMALDPPMVQAFFMSAQLLVDEDRIDEARENLRTGIEHARSQGDGHAAAEMSELLSSLGQYGEL